MIDKAHVNNTLLMFNTGQSLLLGFLQMHLARVSYRIGQIYSHQLITGLSFLSGDGWLVQMHGDTHKISRTNIYFVLIIFWAHQALSSSGSNCTNILKRKQLLPLN